MVLYFTKMKIITDQSFKAEKRTNEQAKKYNE